MRLSFHSDGWDWGEGEREWSIFRRRMSTVARGFAAALADVELEDGWVELELAVGAERSFHGIVWRAADDRNYESFFVRPHQVGNPDAGSTRRSRTGSRAGSSTTVTGPGLARGFRSVTGFGSASTSPAVVPNAGRRPHDRCARLPAQGAAAARPDRRARQRARRPLRRPCVRGGLGIDPAPPPQPAAPAGVIRAWEVSDAFAEEELDAGARRAALVDAGRERAGRPRRSCARAGHRGRQEHRPRARDDPGRRRAARRPSSSASATARTSI